jgi:hypothetical protein
MGAGHAEGEVARAVDRLEAVIIIQGYRALIGEDNVARGPGEQSPQLGRAAADRKIVDVAEIDAPGHTLAFEERDLRLDGITGADASPGVKEEGAGDDVGGRVVAEFADRVVGRQRDRARCQDGRDADVILTLGIVRLPTVKSAVVRESVMLTLRF